MLRSNLQLFQLELLLPTTRNIALKPCSNSGNDSHQHLHSNQNAQQYKASASIDTVAIKVMRATSTTRSCFPFAGPAVKCFILAEPYWIV